MNESTRMLTIVLSEEQARLYHTSVHFKASVESLLRVVIPPFLDGVAARAEAADKEMEAGIEAVKQMIAATQAGLVPEN